MPRFTCLCVFDPALAARTHALSLSQTRERITQWGGGGGSNDVQSVVGSVLILQENCRWR